ncbi:NACHT domain-containing protein [Nannocystis pusilla]
MAWTRYVVPRGKPIQFDIDGFPHEPTRIPALQPDAWTLDDMLATQCLVLLGEPGLGKSVTLLQAYERIHPAVPETERLYLDGRDQFDPEVDLFKAPQFIRWRDEGRPLHLFIDSLDEGPSGLTPRLLSKLRGDRPRSRMHLRLACRTGELPEQLDRELPQLWPEQTNFFELVPLTQEDIALTAGIRAPAFLESVRRQGIASLAILPVTLQFLLQLFHEHKDLPDTRAELYEQGCRILCEESSVTRSDRGAHGRLDPDRRLDIASQIAAVCTLARRPLVQRKHDRGQLANDAIRWRDLRTSWDPEAQRPAVGDDELRETLHQTGLFRSQGPLYLGFAHASHIAFLAARFLKSRRIRLPDLVARCTAHVTPGPLPATVRDLAGWLAHDDPEAWKWLLEHDPRVLLLSDLRRTSPTDRAALTATLIEHANTQRLPLHGLAAHYRHLAHDGLADQLRPWIRDRERHFLARETAIKIAGACACREMEPELVNLVLADEPNRLRGEALYTLSRIGAPDTWRALLPLLTDPNCSAPDPWSRGRLIRLLWPDRILPGELIAILDAAVTRGDDQLSYFIEHTLVPTASDDLLVELFGWLRAVHPDKYHTRTPNGLREQLLDRALRNLESPKILEALAHYLFLRTRSHEDPFWYHDGGKHRSLLESSDRSTRRTVISAMFKVGNSRIRHDRLKSWNLLDAGDLDWLVEQYLEEPHPTRRAGLRDLLAGAVEDPLPSGVTAVRLWDAVEQDGELRTALWRWLGPVALDSEEARDMRKAHEQREKWADESRQREASLERDREWECGQLPRLIQAMNEATTDMKVLHELFHKIQYFKHDDRGYPVPTDIPATPAWKALPEASHARLLSLATEVLGAPLLPHEPHPFPSRYRAPFLVHYSFLRLVQAQSPGWLEAQPVERWKVWMPAIVFNTSNIENKEAHTDLLRAAYGCAPDAVKLGFALLLSCVTHAAQFEVVFTWIEQILGDGAIAFVELKLEDDTYPAEPYGALLECLLKSPRVNEVAAILDRLLGGPLDRPEPRARACVAAEILWRRAPDFAWPRLVLLFESHTDFAIEVLNRAAARHLSIQGELWNNKDEDALVAVYAWLAERFPEKLDPPSTGRIVDNDERHRLGRLRNSLRHNLQARGTPSSLAALERLKTLLPGETSLTWSCGYARDSVADATWRPLAPDQILRLHHRRPRPPRDLYDFFLDNLSAAEMRRLADDFAPPFPEELPAGTASSATLAYELSQALARRESLRDSCARLRQIRPELADELDHLAAIETVK